MSKRYWPQLQERLTNMTKHKSTRIGAFAWAMLALTISCATETGPTISAFFGLPPMNASMQDYALYEISVQKEIQACMAARGYSYAPRLSTESLLPHYLNQIGTIDFAGEFGFGVTMSVSSDAVAGALEDIDLNPSPPDITLGAEAALHGRPQSNGLCLYTASSTHSRDADPEFSIGNRLVLFTASLRICWSRSKRMSHLMRRSFQRALDGLAAWPHMAIHSKMSVSFMSG